MNQAFYATRNRRKVNNFLLTIKLRNKTKRQSTKKLYFEKKYEIKPHHNFKLE